MHCLNYFAIWHIRSSKSYEALNFQWKTVSDNSLMYSYWWKNFGLALDSLSDVSQLSWETWKRKHCPSWYVYDKWCNWAAARIPQFLLEDNKTNSNSRKPWERWGFRFLLTNTAEQITAIKNGKLARTRKQNSLTDSASTGLENLYCIKWSTNKLNMCRNWSWSFFVYTAFLRKNGESKSKSFHCSTRITKTWMISKAFWPFRQCGRNWKSYGHLWLLSGQQCRLQWTQET